MESEKNTFETLAAINVNKHTEKKNGLTYLSWSFAWSEVKKAYSEASYSVDEYEGKPYLFDENLGYIVSTTVCINGETLPMHLPVMDGANKAMTNKEYEYNVKDWNASNAQKKEVYKTKVVSKATMFDINKTIMRCLVKNLAMFGLGLYIYAGEDLPEEEVKEIEKKKEEQKGIIAETRKKVEAYLTKSPDYCKKVLDGYKVDKIENLTDAQIKQINDVLTKSKK